MEHKLKESTSFDQVRTQARSLLIDQQVASVVVAAADGEKVVWEEAFGWADVENRVPATPHTLYSLASITKPITTTALMILVERGQVDLDGPIQDYLGEVKLTAYAGSVSDVTVRSVANHTSGLPLHYQFFYEDDSRPVPAREDSIRRYGILVQPPGESYVYSNLGYGLLECVIENVSGKSYDEFLQAEVFTPLGLEESGIGLKDLPKAAVAARYHGGRRVPFYDFNHRGGSAAYMSVHDLIRFGLFHQHGRIPGRSGSILRPETLLSMRANAVSTGAASRLEKRTYSIGMQVGERQGLQRFGHTGGMAGVATRLSIYPDAGIVVAVLSNSEAHQGVSDLEDGIVHALRPDTIRHDHGFTPPPNLLGSWQGEVRTSSDPVAIALEFRGNGSVLATIGAQPAQEVVAIGFDAATSLLTLAGLAGDIRTSDSALYPYSLQLSLKYRSPAALTGVVSAVSHTAPDRWGNALSHWIELRKLTE